MARVGNRTDRGGYMLGSWKELGGDDTRDYVERQVIATDRITVIRCVYRAGTDFPEHFHPQEQMTIVEEGALEFVVSGKAVLVRKGEMICVEPNTRHATRVANGRGSAVALNLFLRPAESHAGSSGGTGVGTVLSRPR